MPLVQQCLADHPKVHLHFTPTYSSWLNQVELWFGKIERDVIARGVFTSVPDLKRKLMRYIRLYNQTPRPIKWKYAKVVVPSRIPGTDRSNQLTGYLSRRSSRAKPNASSANVVCLGMRAAGTGRAVIFRPPRCARLDGRSWYRSAASRLQRMWRIAQAVSGSIDVVRYFNLIG